MEKTLDYKKRTFRAGWLWALTFWFASSVLAQAQSFGYEWLNPHQEYIKIQLAQTGIFRLTGTTLNIQAVVNPNNLHLYYRGEEIPIYVANVTNNGRFDSADYIEFFGRRNDGAVESLLYRDPQTGHLDPDQQPNVYRSMFKDTSAYFLTWNDQPRASEFTYQTYNSNPDGPAVLQTSYRAEVRKDFMTEPYQGSGSSGAQWNQQLNSDYITGEGYTGPTFGGAQTITLPTPHAAQTASLPVTLKARVVGVTATPHQLKVAFGSVNQTVAYVGAVINTFPFSGAQTDVGSPETDVTLTPQGAYSDYNRLCWVSIEYERLLKFDGEKQFPMKWKDAAVSDALFELEGMSFSAANDSGFVYDLTNRRRIRGKREGNKLRVIIPKSGKELDLWATTGSQIAAQSTSELKVKPQYLRFLFKPETGAEFVIITHRALKASAEAYAAYRRNNPYNRFSSKVVFMDEIVNEFGYGTMNPLALQRFCYVATQTWDVKPKYFLLWGKGWSPGLVGNRGDDCLPTWGYPACDAEFVSNVFPEKTNIIPHTPIGRVNLDGIGKIGDKEGLDYLAKIKEYESTKFQPWMKQAVHLGGGATPPEVSSISLFFKGSPGASNGINDIYKSAPLGGNVYYYQKNSSETVSDIQDGTITDLINSGTSVVTFMGHSSSNIFDVALNQPYEYKNWGRYPFMIANGCYTGDYSNNPTTMGEAFMKEPGRGAIGYLSTSSTGYVSYLTDYSKHFYGLAFRDSIGKPIGDIIKWTIRNYLNQNGDQGTVNHCKHNNLQGDPALRLYHPDSVDLAVNQSSLYFEPEDFTAEADEINLNVVIYNNGLVSKDSFNVSVKQTVLETGLTIDYGKFRLPPVRSADTLTLRIQNPGKASGGINEFEIYVDCDQKIPEIYETNNRIVIQRYINSFRPAIIYPWRFAVINKNAISLRASATGILNEKKVRYIFEIDTTPAFNSPQFIRSDEIMGTSQEGAWELPIGLIDSTVYYWRVRLIDAPGVFWSEASFQYIYGPSEGWGQARVPQFFGHSSSGVKLSQSRLSWEFEPQKQSVQVYAGPWTGTKFSVGTSTADTRINDMSGYVLFSIIDGNTLQTITTDFDLANMDYATVPTQAGDWGTLDKLVNAIQTMRDGDYLAAIGRAPRVKNWPEAVFNAFESLGVTQNIRQAGEFFVVLARKGGGYGSAKEVWRPNVGQDVYGINTTLYANRPSGVTRSEIIGPAAGWQTLIWNWKQNLNDGADNIKANLIGLKNGNETVLRKNLSPGSYDISDISTDDYPQLRLEGYFQDTILRTSPQLDDWYVLYQPAPEATINSQLDYAFIKDTVIEGDEIYIRLAMENISERNMDSMLVKYEVRRPDRTVQTLKIERVGPLAKEASRSIDARFSTKDLPGANTLIVTINPDFDQPERFLFNNVYYQTFYVVPDVINPLLDVTFDGRRIIDGDYVRPTPVIAVEVHDENRYLTMTDTTCVSVYFKPDSTYGPAPQVFHSTGLLTFQPASASAPENRARLTFKPERLAPGSYVLQAQGIDVKGNPAGEYRYSINFNVRETGSMSDVAVMPNPTQGYTRFVYSLTGETLPTEFKIDIHTINGKKIKSIDVLREGGVAIGRDVVAYTWDATDDFGEGLADGIYLFNVRVQFPSGANLTKINEEGRPLLQNGWGKIMLIR